MCLTTLALSQSGGKGTGKGGMGYWQQVKTEKRIKEEVMKELEKEKSNIAKDLNLQLQWMQLQLQQHHLHQPNYPSSQHHPSREVCLCFLWLVLQKCLGLKLGLQEFWLWVLSLVLSLIGIVDDLGPRRWVTTCFCGIRPLWLHTRGPCEPPPGCHLPPFPSGPPLRGMSGWGTLH